MKRLFHILFALLFIATLFSASTSLVYASSDDEHALEMEVNGYHIELANQNEWKKGENTIVVTLMDSMGMPVQNADVEILVASKTDEHSTSENTHGAEQQHDSMSEMDMGETSTQASSMPEHEEQATEPLAMTELHEHGKYTVKTHLESSGEHEIKVRFHINDEMLQATFIVNILQSSSKSLVLWGFVAVNVVLISSAGILKKQSIPVKGD